MLSKNKNINDLNLNLLKKLLPSAESKDFASAAKKLNETTGSLSTQLNQLELSLGVNIFERKGNQRTTQLTTEGKRIYELYNNLDEEIKKLQKGEKNYREEHKKIKIITTSGLSPYIFSKLYINSPEIFNKYLIEVESSQTKDTIKGCDFLIRSDIAHKEYINIEKLLHMEFCFYASHEYLKKCSKPEKLIDLRNHNVIFSRILYYYDSFNDTPQKLPIHIENARVFICSDVSTLVSLCKMGLGITELPLDYPNTEGLVKFTLTDYLLTNNIYMAYSKELKKEDSKFEFLRILKNVFK